MSCFKFPISTCNSINGDLGRFWWGDSDRANHIHWKSWKYLCRSKMYGGMEFKNLETLIFLFLQSSAGEFGKPRHFWVHVLKAKYFPRYGFLKVSRSTCPSWAWSSLLKGRRIILEEVKWHVGNGESVMIRKIIGCLFRVAAALGRYK